MAEREILNIQEAVSRLKEEGMPVSEYTLRRAIRSGAVPCRCVGRTYLIAWSNVMKWLMCEDGADNVPLSGGGSGGIRRLEVDARI